MELSKIITQMAILFLIMLIGFISNRKGILDSEHTKFFSRLVLTVGMPGTIIASVANGSPFGSRAQTCSYLGGMVTPAGMLIIGSSLAGVSLKELRCEWRLVPFLLLKLIGLPVVFYFVCAPFVADKMLVMVAATILAMPCATNAVLFSNTYGGNVRVSSKVVFLATLCSLITIPLVGGLLF